MQSLRSLLRLMVSPTDEYEELKYKNGWNIPLSLLLLALWFISSIVQRQLTNFKFNHNNIEEINVLYIAVGTFVLFVGWVVINWAITTLLDGKGSVREIWAACAYALVPYIASVLLNAVLSQFAILEEGSFLAILSGGGILWSVFLLVTALRVVHSYSFGKTLLSILLTILGILFVIFLIVLFFGLIQQVILFFQTIYMELMYRR